MEFLPVCCGNRTSESTVAFEERANAWLNYFNCRNAHEDLRGYHKRLFEAFADEFGIPRSAREFWLDESGEEMCFADPPLVSGVVQAAQLATEDHTPWAGILEARDLTSIFRRHGAYAESASKLLQKINRDIFADMMKQSFPEASLRTASLHALYQRGAPRGSSPDPVDYF